MAWHDESTAPDSIHQIDFVSATDPSLDAANQVAAHKRWLDTSTTPYTQKIRNAGNTAWVTLFAPGDYATQAALDAVEDAAIAADAALDARVDALESAPPGGVAVEEDGVAVASGVMTINFADFASVSDDGGGQVTVTAPAGGGGGGSGANPHKAFVPPVNADFSWVNQTSGGVSATVTADASKIHLSTTYAGSYQARLRKYDPALPATPWRCRAAIQPLMWGDNSAGIYVRNSATGNLITWVVRQNHVMTAWRSTLTAQSSAPVNVTPTVGPALLWLQIECDGTNVWFSISYDGENFIQLGPREALATFLSAVTDVGLIVDCQINSTGTAAQSKAALTCWSWEVETY